MAGIRTFIALEAVLFQIAKLFLDLYTNVHYNVLYFVRCRRREGLRRDPKPFVRRDADDQTEK